MTSNTIDIATINKLALYAIEKADLVLFETTLKKHGATNLQECLDKAMQNNFTAGINLILAQMKTPTESSTEENLVVEVLTTGRPLVIISTPLFLKMNGGTLVSLGLNNSAFVYSICNDPAQALNDLNAGTVSKKELDHANSAGYTPLSILIQYGSHITNSQTLILKIIELGADINFKEGTDGSTSPLVMACMYPNDFTETILDTCLKNKTLNLNTKNTYGNTVLMIALIFRVKNPVSYIKKLIEDPRTDLKVFNQSKRTILDFIDTMVGTHREKADILFSYYKISGWPFSFKYDDFQVNRMSDEERMTLIELSLKYK